MKAPFYGSACLKERRKMDNNDAPLTEHLTELRKRLIICIVAFFLIFPVAFYYSEQVCDYIFSVLTDMGCKIYLYGITDALVIRISISLITSIIVELPLIVFELFRFIFPGLKDNEKKTVVCLTVAVSICFFVGSIIFMLLLAPLIIRAWLQYDYSVPDRISAKKFYNAWLLCTCISGVIFCIPILIFCIVRLRKRMGY
jgi:sec-independent protein translocase protein TatC